MRIYPEKLTSHLATSLAPVYLVSGDEPLQMIEATDAIRARARDAGFTQRMVFEGDGDFDWQGFLAAGQSMSLFGDRQLLDVRFKKTPDKEAREALQTYLNSLSEDNLLLISAPKLDKKTQAQKWYTALDKTGVCVQVWPVKPNELGAWLTSRARSLGLTPDASAVALLTERVEGNLLAAAQELDKLRLLHGPGALTAEQVAEAAADSARFNIFDLVDTCLAGKRRKVVRMIEGLRAEGSAAVQVLWWLVKDIRILAVVAQNSGPGQSLDALLARHGVWDTRKALFKKALTGFPRRHWQTLMLRCAELDCLVKGQGTGNVWDDLLELALQLSPPEPGQKGRVRP